MKSTKVYLKSWNSIKCQCIIKLVTKIVIFRFNKKQHLFYCPWVRWISRVTLIKDYELDKGSIFFFTRLLNQIVFQMYQMYFTVCVNPCWVLNFDCNFHLWMIFFPMLNLWHAQSNAHTHTCMVHEHTRQSAHMFTPDISLVHERSITVYQH